METATPTTGNTVVEIREGAQRRKRLWDIPSHCHCAIVGVCLPAAVLRRLARKVLVNPAAVDDYTLHAKAVQDSGGRNPFSKAMQEDLEKRYVVAIHTFRELRHRSELEQAWRDAIEAGQISGALWAVLTHPACDQDLAAQVDQELHVLQHRAISLMNSDFARAEALIEENATLGAALAKAQQRCDRVIREKSAEIEQLQAQLMRLRGESVGRETELASLRAERDEALAAVPDLTARRRLEHQIVYYQERNARLVQEIAELRGQMCQRRDSAPLTAANPVRENPGKVEIPEPSLEERRILCVGGREHAVVIYRQLIEGAGARFLHHDGGIEDRLQQLDSDLSAADLVICQTGCISHNAYWRVKDHCKRTGKRCVFVDKPSASGLTRSLQGLLDEALAAAPDDVQN